MSYIGLLDCNNFFVSCERLFRPDLRKQPTLVLSSNDGCVVARSQEVKDLGIPMGVPYFKIKDIVKQHKIAVFSGNFTLYRDISSRVMQVLREEVGNVEQYSIDEAFFALSHDTIELEAELQRIRSVIETQVGIPVSLGLGSTKTIAKYASEKEKKGRRACVLLGEDWYREARTIPVQEIWGIGRKTSATLIAAGITTVADLVATDRNVIDVLLGVVGVRIQAELNEQPAVAGVDSLQLPRSLMSTRSFGQTITKKNELRDALTYHVSGVAADMRKQRVVARTLTVLLLTGRHSDWLLRGGSLQSFFDPGTQDTRVLLREAYRLLDSLYEAGVPYKKAGVVVSDLVDEQILQQSLFSIETPATDAVLQVVDSINERFPGVPLRFGQVAGPKTWHTKHTYISPHYTTQWGEIPSVSA